MRKLLTPLLVPLFCFAIVSVGVATTNPDVQEKTLLRKVEDVENVEEIATAFLEQEFSDIIIDCGFQTFWYIHKGKVDSEYWFIKGHMKVKKEAIIAVEILRGIEREIDYYLPFYMQVSPQGQVIGISIGKFVKMEQATLCNPGSEGKIASPLSNPDDLTTTGDSTEESLRRKREGGNPLLEIPVTYEELKRRCEQELLNLGLRPATTETFFKVRRPTVIKMHMILQKIEAIKELRQAIELLEREIKFRKKWGQGEVKQLTENIFIVYPNFGRVVGLINLKVKKTQEKIDKLHQLEKELSLPKVSAKPKRPIFRVGGFGGYYSSKFGEINDHLRKINEEYETNLELKGGLTCGGRIEYRFTPRWALGVEYSGFASKTSDSYSISGANWKESGSFEVESNLVALLVIATYRFSPGKALCPYIGIGGGPFHSKLTMRHKGVYTHDTVVEPFEELDSETASPVGYQAFLGAEYRGETFGLAVEAGYNYAKAEFEKLPDVDWSGPVAALILGITF